MNCPHCDKPMEHQPYDPDVGIMRGGWFCESCDVFIGDDEVDDDD